MDGQNFVNNYPPQKQPANGFAIASLVVGIVSLVLCCCSEYLGLALGILAIVFAIISKKQGPSGLATAGMVCGIIATVISAVFLVINILTLTVLKGFLPDFNSMNFEEMIEYFDSL